MQPFQSMDTRQASTCLPPKPLPARQPIKSFCDEHAPPIQQLFFHLIVHPHSKLAARTIGVDRTAFPTVDDQVTLYYNSALGNGELQGVIPVYIHTGVITSNSSGPSDWQNVQTAWGTSDPLALLNPEGNGIHTFDFNG